ncbi:MAG TPA: AI-2E family transporter [Burkholderiaceae bacterium]|nr:AI-2E family transporter [Burkholderiaceae bacterium]
MNPSPDAATPIGLRIRASRITTAGVVLALVYFGREVLIPLTLAIILSLLAAPLVRALRRIGIGRAGSVLVTVVTLVVSLAAIATALGVQVLRIAESLPQYEANVQRKLGALDEMTFGRLRVLTNEVNRVIELQQPPEAAPDQAAFFAQRAWVPRSGPVAARSPAAPSNALQLRKLLASVWRPVQTAGIVLLVLVFVLLEHESLRDRIIRLAGATDIRATTLALNDAGARLSRFFVSQFTVNLAFAAAVWLSLSLLHLPQAMLLGVLAGVLRFVPYVGVGIAALLSTALAFAVDPGWSLAAMTLGVFIVLDIVAGQLLEPHLYGHATGLSPLAVVIGTIFWSALWGPAGLILSTPLTLCLVVAGRHTKSLGALETLLSDGRALTLPQRFYQRALSGDPHEIVADARAFLKKDSLADYCDRVLIPALHLAQLDSDKGATSDDQHARIRRVIVDVVAALSSSLKLPQVRYRGSVLDNVDPGRWLRQQREQVSGRWQGPIGVQPGSIVICAGLGSPADNLAAELLVRLLRIQKIDARHFSPADVDSGLPPGADPNGVSIVYLMSAFPGPERSRVDPLSQQIRQLLPFASIVKVFCPGVTAASTDGNGGGESSVNSLAQAIQICASSQQVHQLRAQATRHQLIQPALLRS